MSESKRFKVLIEVQQPDGSWSSKLSQEDYDFIFRYCGEDMKPGVMSTEQAKEITGVYYLGKTYDNADSAQYEVHDLFNMYYDVNADIEIFTEDERWAKYRWRVIDTTTGKAVYPIWYDKERGHWTNPSGDVLPSQIGMHHKRDWPEPYQAGHDQT